MDAMLGDLDFATAYLDNIFITSKSVTEHRKHIMCVFDKPQEYGFKVKETKCDFFQAEMKYLGHIINKDGRRPHPDRATAIKDMQANLANFYQVFIRYIHNLGALPQWTLAMNLRKIKPGAGHQNAKLHSKK